MLPQAKVALIRGPQWKWGGSPFLELRQPLAKTCWQSFPPLLRCNRWGVQGAVRACTALLLVAAMVSRPTLALADTPSDAQARQHMIAESIAAYPGHCPCPYN